MAEKPIEQIYIGIDTGVHTGIAVWSRSRKMFLKLEECEIHQAMFLVLKIQNNTNYRIIRVRVEDARKRSGDKARAFGAGSVCRDASVWEGYLKDFAIPYEMVAPQSNTTKMTKEKFRQSTGLYQESEHVRDAANLVLGM